MAAVDLPGAGPAPAGVVKDDHAPGVVPHLPVRRGPGVAVLLVGLLTGLMLLGVAGVWRYVGFDALTTRDVPAAGPAIEAGGRPDLDAEALLPGRAPPTAGGSRPTLSAADEVPIESAGSEVPVGIDDLPEEAGSAAGQPPPRLHGGPAAIASDSPPLPITDDPADLDGLRAAVLVANARDIDALYEASPNPRGPQTRMALDLAVRALAKGLYRHHVVDGHGDLAAARAELRAFLRGLEHKGLGLSDAVVESGVAHVGP